MTPTRVVNVRNCPVLLDGQGRETDYPACLYVGRYIPGQFAGHALGNPFKLRRGARVDERRECLAKYAEWLGANPDAAFHLKRLAGKVKRTGLPLGCWCAPKQCHADLLAACIDRILEIPDSRGDE